MKGPAVSHCGCVGVRLAQVYTWGLEWACVTEKLWDKEVLSRVCLLSARSKSHWACCKLWAIGCWVGHGCLAFADTEGSEFWIGSEHAHKQYVGSNVMGCMHKLETRRAARRMSFQTGVFSCCFPAKPTKPAQPPADVLCTLSLQA